MKTTEKITDFLTDDDFILFAVHPTPELQKRWQEYFRFHPELLSPATKALKILRGETDYIEFPSAERLELKSRILEAIHIPVG